MAWALEQNAGWLPEGKKKQGGGWEQKDHQEYVTEQILEICTLLCSTEGMTLSSNKGGVRNAMLMNCWKCYSLL